MYTRLVHALIGKPRPEVAAAVVHQGPTFTATTLDFTSSTLAARVWTPIEQSPASHLQTRDDRRQRLQVRVVPRDASAPGRRELYTSVHRAAECRESPCGVALRQESLDVEALCRYLALKQHVVNILGSDQLHLHRVCQLGPRGDGRVHLLAIGADTQRRVKQFAARGGRRGRLWRWLWKL